MSTVVDTHSDIVPRLEAASERVQRAHKAAASVIFGQDVVIERTLITILSGGHALLIGVPGLAKTLLVETLGKVLGLDAKRVQFTPDLMPPISSARRSWRTRPASRAPSASSRARSSPSS
jgi:MoxR-like ATPase